MKNIHQGLSSAAMLSFLLLGTSVHAAKICPKITGIEGRYTCGGECVVTDDKGNKSLISVSNEVDTIARWEGSKHGIYQVKIEGSNGFFEVEIGTLVNNTMATATSKVSDGLYPVLEEYVFSGDAKCRATQFTKTVLNPIKDNFKACAIQCVK